jgi:hypothetical protein
MNFYLGFIGVIYIAVSKGLDLLGAFGLTLLSSFFPFLASLLLFPIRLPLL